MLPSTNRHWEVTDELLDESGTCGMPLHKRLRRAIIRRDQLRLHRLELIAIDAALDETLDALSQQNERSLLVRLAEIGANVDQQSQRGLCETLVSLTVRLLPEMIQMMATRRIK
jgi:hypothetical protein